MPRQIVDGFTMNPYIRMNPYDFNALALGQLDTLRRAKGYKPRWYAMPDLTDPKIQPTDTFQRQVQVKPGTYVWGISPVLLYSGGAGGSGQDFNGSILARVGTTHFYIRDDGTGIPFFDDFIADWMLSTVNYAIQAPGNYYSGVLVGDLNTGLYPVLLSQPRLIDTPGLISIMITNSNPWNFGGGVAVRCQVVLHCAEPCERQNNGALDPCNQ